MSKRILSIILCVCLVATLSIFFVSCDKDSDDVYTYHFDGQTYYLQGASFKDGGTLTVYKNGNVDGTYTVNKDMVSNFSTGELTGNSKFDITANGSTYSVNYFVGKEATAIDGLAYELDETTGVKYYADLKYGDRYDAEKEDISQLFDIYLPSNYTEDSPVLLYVHGGAWMVASKTQEGTKICRSYAENGFVVFSMNYIMQSDFIGSEIGTIIKEATMANMVGDIGIMISYMKSLLPQMGIETDKIALSGESAGGHLSTLYAYSMNEYSPLTIAFEVDIVGPTQFSNPLYKEVVNSIVKGTHSNPLVNIFAQNLVEPLINGFLGVEEGVYDYTAEDLDPIWDAMDVYSSIFYIDETSCPTILAYGKRSTDTSNYDSISQMFDSLQIFPEGAETDLLVPCSTFYDMMDTLEKYNVPHVGKLFEGQTHVDVAYTADTIEYITTNAVAYAELYL